MTFKEALLMHSETFGIHWSEKQIEQLEVFYYMVVEKNKVMNLTGIVEEEEFVLKHIIDSISCVEDAYFPKHARVIDVGTGAGFPGIPLAIFREDLKIVLFDSLQKRLTFLEEVIKRIALSNVMTLHGRAEDIAHQKEYREQFDIATSRAVARLPVLLEYTLPFVKVGGVFVALKGAAYHEEEKESIDALHILGGKKIFSKEVTLPTLDDNRIVIYIGKEKSTIKRYPRKPKEIKDHSL